MSKTTCNWEIEWAEDEYACDGPRTIRWMVAQIACTGEKSLATEEEGRRVLRLMQELRADLLYRLVRVERTVVAKSFGPASERG